MKVKDLRILICILCIACVSTGIFSCDKPEDNKKPNTEKPDGSGSQNPDDEDDGQGGDQDNGNDGQGGQAEPKDKEFVILFTNDFHSQIEPLSKDETYNADREASRGSRRWWTV
jgi:hypothetical protein